MDTGIQNATNMAREVAKKYNPKTLVPFPFSKILDQREDLEIICGPTTQDGISGAILYDKETNKYRILINSDEPETRQNFSIAHELGHYFLHQTELKGCNSQGFISAIYGADNALLRKNILAESQKTETEANTFAAELIMPSHKMRQVFNQAKGLTIEEYARIFHVSPAAMAIRVERLGLSHGG